MSVQRSELRARREPWRVLIVEDNPRVAALHWKVVEGMEELEPVGWARDGGRGYAAAAKLRPDLAIIDLTMPQGSGFDFLLRVRSETLALEVIVVTASRDPASVRRARHLGVIDYLVKPFGLDRLRGALTAFVRQANAMQRNQLRQEDIDLIHVSVPRLWHRLPRGLRLSTMRTVRAVLEAADGPMTAEEVGCRAGIARVTARRYLEYLEVIGDATLEREAHGPGRPRNRYRSVGGPGGASSSGRRRSEPPPEDAMGDRPRRGQSADPGGGLPGARLRAGRTHVAQHGV
jgi:two-component system response regulator DctR